MGRWPAILVVLFLVYATQFGPTMWIMERVGRQGRESAERTYFLVNAPHFLLMRYCQSYYGYASRWSRIYCLCTHGWYRHYYDRQWFSWRPEPLSV